MIIVLNPIPPDLLSLVGLIGVNLQSEISVIDIDLSSP